MKQYLLTFEFRYMKVPTNAYTSGQTSKTITIGIYDTIEEAVEFGNQSLVDLAKTFDVRDKFKVRGLFGMPDTLVSNSCTKDKVTFFGKITTLDYRDLNDMVAETLKSRKDYEYEISDANKQSQYLGD